MATVSGRRFQSTLPNGGVVMATAFGSGFRALSRTGVAVMAGVPERRLQSTSPYRG